MLPSRTGRSVKKKKANITASKLTSAQLIFFETSEVYVYLGYCILDKILEGLSKCAHILVTTVSVVFHIHVAWAIFAVRYVLQFNSISTSHVEN